MCPKCLKLLHGYTTWDTHIQFAVFAQKVLVQTSMLSHISHIPSTKRQVYLPIFPSARFKPCVACFRSRSDALLQIAWQLIKRDWTGSEGSWWLYCNHGEVSHGLSSGWCQLSHDSWVMNPDRYIIFYLALFWNLSRWLSSAGNPCSSLRSKSGSCFNKFYCLSLSEQLGCYAMLTST